jgi:hypothetical protein
MKKIDEKILNEILRYNSITNYILEQDAELPPPPGPEAGTVPPPPDADAGTIPPPPGPEAGTVPPPPDADAGTVPPPQDDTQTVDINTDPDVEKVGDEKENTKELDITDLVTSQKNVEEKQEEYFNNLFKHLTDLETRLGEMDNIMTKLNNLETKIEKIRPKSAQEKLELRTLDSGPFNQKLSDFFEDKQEDFEKTGRDEYILTKDEVEDYSSADIKKSFRNFGDEEETQFNQIQ